MVETQHVLGDEWKRVKAGEPTFRITKYVAFIFLIGAIIALISLAISSTSSTETVQDINKPQQKSDPNKLLSKDAEPPISIK